MLVPKVVFKNVTRITPDFLRAHGIRALVLDVDNTLAPHGGQEVREDVQAWLYWMRESGVRLLLASNNFRARVEPLAKKLGLPFVSFCCKPAPFWLVKANRLWNLPRENIALVGDQVFTDLLCGRLWGVRVLLVRPLYEDHKPLLRLRRHLEKPLLLRYYKGGGELL